MEENALKELENLILDKRKVSFEIEKVEDQLKSLKTQEEHLARELIPSLLNRYGLSEIRLSSGEKVIVKDNLKASIADKNYSLAYHNMIDAEGDDKDQAENKVKSLFKVQTVIEDPSPEVLNLLMENSVVYDMKHSIHPQTLKKYCKDRLENGKTIPEGISVYQYQEADIK